MDEETRKIFDDLLGEKVKKRPETRFTAGRRDTYEHIRRESFEEAMRRDHETEKRRREEAAFSFRHARREPEPAPPPPPVEEEHNTLEHIAVLSVNQAKACIVFRAPTNSRVRSEITRLAGPGQAKYNKQDDVWELHPAILPGIKSVLKTHYKDVQVLGVQKQVQATKFDQLMARLSKDDKDKIYKLLALKYHPDKGGDKETMVLVNLVFKGGA